MRNVRNIRSNSRKKTPNYKKYVLIFSALLAFVTASLLIERPKQTPINTQKITKELSSNYHHLEYVASLEKVLSDENLQKALRNIHHTSYDLLIKNLEVSVNNFNGREIVLIGHAKDMEGKEEAILVIPSDGSNCISSSIFTHTLSDPLPSFVNQSSDTSGNCEYPTEISEWQKKFKNIKIHGQK